MSDKATRGGWRTNKWIRAAIPALLLHCSIGTVYCWSIFSENIGNYIGFSKGACEWAFSLAIFFLGMSAAFLGNIVEKDIHKSSLIAAVCFAAGMAGTGAFIWYGGIPNDHQSGRLPYCTIRNSIGNRIAAHCYTNAMGKPHYGHICRNGPLIIAGRQRGTERETAQSKQPYCKQGDDVENIWNWNNLLRYPFCIVAVAGTHPGRFGKTTDN